MTLPGQPSGVSQTNFVFAIVFVAYLIFITLRGDLAKWLGVFGLAQGSMARSSAAPAASAPAPYTPPANPTISPGTTSPGQYGQPVPSAPSIFGPYFP